MSAQNSPQTAQPSINAVVQPTEYLPKIRTDWDQLAAEAYESTGIHTTPSAMMALAGYLTLEQIAAHLDVCPAEAYLRVTRASEEGHLHHSRVMEERKETRVAVIDFLAMLVEHDSKYQRDAIGRITRSIGLTVDSDDIKEACSGYLKLVRHILFSTAAKTGLGNRQTKYFSLITLEDAAARGHYTLQQFSELYAEARQEGQFSLSSARSVRFLDFLWYLLKTQGQKAIPVFREQGINVSNVEVAEGLLERVGFKYARGRKDDRIDYCGAVSLVRCPSVISLRRVKSLCSEPATKQLLGADTGGHTLSRAAWYNFVRERGEGLGLTKDQLGQALQRFGYVR